MNCKRCNAELDENINYCPVCGKKVKVLDDAPASEKQKPALWKIITASVAGVVLVAVLTLAILGPGMGVIKLKNIPAFFGFTEAGLDYKNSYTVSDAKAEKKADVVIAKMGNQTLTNGELQAYYWLGVYDFVNNYSYYLTQFGLDLSEPLDKQIYDEKTGMTFQQFFLENALESWRRYAALAQMAEDAGYEPTDEIKEYLADFNNQMKANAEEAGYTDVEEYMDKEFFPGSSLAAYYNYTHKTYMALGYFDSLYEGMMPTDAEIEAYYAANEATLVGKGVGKDAGDYYDVRHILIEIEGESTKDENGATVYTDAQWEACRAKAQKLLDEFLAGEKVDEEAFGELAKKHSKDPGSAESGGLYTDLTKDTNFIEGFKNWYLEEGRKAGDTGLVKNTQSSVQGYHIMYFCESRPIWEYEVRTLVLSENTSKLLEEAENRWPMNVDYKKLVLGYIDLLANQ